MTERFISLAGRIYNWLLCLYPSEWREKFGQEMQFVFSEASIEATKQGHLGRFFLRELRDTPGSLAKVYWYRWTRQWQVGRQRLYKAIPTDDLPPPPPDGRDAWQQVGWELSLFLLAALLFVLTTYLIPASLHPGWQHDMTFLGRIVIPLTLPIFLLGLVRGLPRWAYPFGGLLIGYHALAAGQFGLRPFLIIMLLATAILVLAALMMNPQPTPLPVPLRRIGQSLSLDWTRLSFCVYGAMPLVIILAFDDGYTNNRTPYLALSAAVMVAGALLYARSRHNLTQIVALIGGMSLAVVAAWLDKITFAGGLGNWLATPYPDTAEITWMLQWWFTWTCLILSPALLTTFSQAHKLKRAT